MSKIILDRVSLDFPIFNSHSKSIRSLILAVGSGGRLHRDSHKRVYVEALNDVSVSLGQGDRVALIGHNGAGKSTLLRVMAGVYPPTKGSVICEGRISTMFDLSLGLEDDATGIENIYLSGYSRGLLRSEIEKLIPDISAFSELGDYLELPLRTYSSGMRMRLVFSIGACIEPEVLLIDEVFGVGDAAFVAKAQRRMFDLLSSSRIVVFASHAMELVRSVCTTGILLREGRVIAFDEIGKIIEAYARGPN